ncbi:MAG: hypothetical protein LC104_15710 [Bacteroidales bacterium]|nr:hypothetical protein [Bacteroidales bacterium]
MCKPPAGYDTATADSDYVLYGTADFSPGSSTAFVSLWAPADNVVEPGNRAIEVSIDDIPMPSGGSGGSWSGGGSALSAIITLPDDPPTVWIEWDTNGSGGSGGGASGGLAAREGGSANLAVRRHGGDLGQPLTVALQITPNDPNVSTTWLDDFTVGYGGTPISGGDGSWYIPITINAAYYSDGTYQGIRWVDLYP